MVHVRRRIAVGVVVLAILAGGALAARAFLFGSRVAGRALPFVAAASDTCAGTVAGLLTHPLADMTAIKAIQAVGSTNGTDHILPRDHSDFYLNDGSLAVSPKTTVAAPADLTVDSIAKHTDYDSSGQPYTGATNYMVSTTICGGVHFWVEWLHELSPQLTAAFDGGTKHHDEGPLNNGARAANDTVNLHLAVRGGDPLGTAGGERKDDAFSISLYDYRIQPRSDVNWSYYRGVSPYDRRYFACFSDYYAEPLKSQIEAKYGYYRVDGPNTVFVPSNAQPKCGSIMQNVPGTIRGDWFFGKPSGGGNPLQSQGRTISFINNSLDWAQGVISIGGTVVDHPTTDVFALRHGGTVNTDFAETSAGGAYCYEAEAAPGPQGMSPAAGGRLLVQLIDDHTLQVEHQDGSCGAGALAFTAAAKRYAR